MGGSSSKVSKKVMNRDNNEIVDIECKNWIVVDNKNEIEVPENVVKELEYKKYRICYDILNDGNCLFHCISKFTNINHSHLRRDIFDYLIENKNNIVKNCGISYHEVFKNQDDYFNKDWDEMLKYVLIDGNWEYLPTEYILKIFCDIYDLKFIIYSTTNNLIQEISGFEKIGEKECILIHISEVHWLCALKDELEDTSSDELIAKMLSENYTE